MTDYFKWDIVEKWLGIERVNTRLSRYCQSGLISLDPPIKPHNLSVTKSPLVAKWKAEDYLTDEELIKLIGRVEQWQIFVIFLALVTFAFIVARLSKWVVIGAQKNQEILDSHFDAGRQASAGIIGTTIVSYWSWAASFLQSTTVTAMYGISGAFWYAAGAAIQVLLFATLTIQMKIKAPGAKTYLQIVRARFDSKTHSVCVFFAILTNLLVTAMLMLGGATVMTSLVEGLSLELGTLLIVGTVFLYTFVGSLNGTMYVSYFNTAVMFFLVLAFLMRVFHSPPPTPSANQTFSHHLGSIERVYETVTCLLGPEDNLQASFLTMFSLKGLTFGIINIIGNFGAVFIDQSYWQCGVASYPISSFGGFIIGGVIWFALPLTFGSTMGLAYRSLQVVDFNSTQKWRALTDDQINRGLVAPFVAYKLLGTSGSLMCVLLIVMAITSTAASQIIAVTSVLIYDIYQIYLKPFRTVIDCSICLLCGCQKGRKAFVSNKKVCVCISMSTCAACNRDNRIREQESGKKPVKSTYLCGMHGAYRTYDEYLQRLKSWCQIIFTIAILPLTITLHYLAISLGWLYSFMGILIGSAVVPLTLCLFWANLNGVAMMSGVIGGTLSGLCAWLVVAAYQPGGLAEFMKNTGYEFSMLAGNLTSILMGSVITTMVSLVSTCLHGPKNGEQVWEVWEMTRDIDNPLRPWTEIYSKELNLQPTDHLDSRPSLSDMEAKYKRLKTVSIAVSSLLSVLMVVVWPALTLIAGVMDFADFRVWIIIVTSVAFIAASFIAVVPPCSEFLRIRAALKNKSKVGSIDDDKIVLAPELPPTSLDMFDAFNNNDGDGGEGDDGGGGDGGGDDGGGGGDEDDENVDGGGVDGGGVDSGGVDGSVVESNKKMDENEKNKVDMEPSEKMEVVEDEETAVADREKKRTKVENVENNNG